MLDEDTHLSLDPEGPVIGSVPLRNVPSKSIVTMTGSLRLQVRNNLAVHVSLSSDSPVKQPGNLAVSNLPANQEADEI